MMIRLLAALGVFMFMALWFLGADHGQYIHPPRPKVAVIEAAPQSRAVFVPSQPVMQEATAAPAPLPVATAPPALPEAPLVAQTVASKVMHVPGGASVRSGPGRAFPVVGDLAAGDAVMVADDTSAPGWVRISVDGRGEGWVAARLLRE